MSIKLNLYREFSGFFVIIFLSSYKVRMSNVYLFLKFYKIEKLSAVHLSATPKFIDSTLRSKLMKWILFMKERDMDAYCCFSQVETWELLNLFGKTKMFSYHICHVNWTKYSISNRQAKVWRIFPATTEQYASKEGCIKWLN